MIIQKGKIKDTFGYIFIYQPNHPFANNKGYVREHRLIMEKFLGRYLLPTEIAHHINEIRDDNRKENLQLILWGQHSTFHLTKYTKCQICGEKHYGKGFCNMHYQRWRRQQLKFNN